MKSRGATQVVPVLKSEPAIWPADLFQTADQPSPSGRWWALHTRPRAEKVLARRLYSQRISFFLPLEHKRLKKPGSPRYSCLPLFPGYVFLRGGEEQRLAALKTNVVIQCLEAADQDRLDSDLRSIALLLQNGLAVHVDSGPAPGTPIEVTSGPLCGFRGTVLRQGSQCRVVVEVDFVQRTVIAEVEDWMIQPTC